MMRVMTKVVVVFYSVVFTLTCACLFLMSFHPTLDGGRLAGPLFGALIPFIGVLGSRKEDPSFFYESGVWGHLNVIWIAVSSSALVLWYPFSNVAESKGTFLDISLTSVFVFALVVCGPSVISWCVKILTKD